MRKKLFFILSIAAIMLASISCDKDKSKGKDKDPAIDPPAVAGSIVESDVMATSVVLNIAEISGAETYKWYKNDAVVQNTASRTYTVTENGTYKVAGVNTAGEGTASPDHVVTLEGEPEPASLSDYFGDYTFAADFFTLSAPKTIIPTIYNDTMYDSSEYDGAYGEMFFANAIGDYDKYGNPAYIDFAYQDNGTISYLDYAYNYSTNTDQMCFVPCVLNSEATSIGFIWEMELELDLDTGKITFPSSFTHSTMGTSQALFVIWAWSSSGAAKGMWSDNFMTNVVATKVGGSPAPAKSAATGDRIVKIPVKITPPAGFDPDAVVRADQIAVRR